MRKFKRVVFISDLHCGHRYGLTPPGWQSDRTPHAAVLWRAYKDLVKRTGAIDLLVVNGDAVDGKGEKNKGIELITTDRHNQAEMAAECLREFNASKIKMTFGTPYHTGAGEYFERTCASELGATIESMLQVDVNGLLFTARHHTGSSQTPMGPVTTLQREKVMLLLDDNMRRGDVVVRSHIHKFFTAQDRNGMVITTPCLQTRTEHGARRCSGDIDLGFLVFDVVSREEWSWKRAKIDVKQFRSAPDIL